MKSSTGISALDAVILALAVFRVTRLITTDVVLEKLREKIWSRFSPARGGIGYMITCTWCTSVWVASLFVLSYMINTHSTIVVAGIFALSAVAGLIDRASS